MKKTESGLLLGSEPLEQTRDKHAFAKAEDDSSPKKDTADTGGEHGKDHNADTQDSSGDDSGDDSGKDDSGDDSAASGGRR